MTRRLRRAATAADDRLPSNECMATMIRRWERGGTGVSERYMLHYCRAFEIEVGAVRPARQPRLQPAGDAGGAQPDARAAAGPPGRAPPWWAGGDAGPGGEQRLAGLLRDIRDGLREDAKIHQVRAGQMSASAASAALCRGQALACTAAAEQIDAALASSTDPAPLP